MGASRTDVLPTSVWSGGVVAAEVDRHPAILVVVEHGYKFQAGAKRFEVLPQCRHAHVLGVFDLGDRSLGHVEPAGEPDLADRFTVTKCRSSASGTARAYQSVRSPDLSPPSNAIAWRRGSNENSTRNAPPLAARSSLID